MLVLSRKESEKIRLGDDIIITIVRVAGDKVRIGIEAPASVPVLRRELKRYESDIVVELPAKPSEAA
jgi:carbon storage regulator